MWSALLISAVLGQAPAIERPRPAPVAEARPTVPSPEFQAELRRTTAMRKARWARGQMKYRWAAAQQRQILARIQATRSGPYLGTTSRSHHRERDEAGESDRRRK